MNNHKSPWDLDVRVRERNLRKGGLDEKDVERYRTDLHDSAANAENVTTPQPTNGNPGGTPPRAPSPARGRRRGAPARRGAGRVARSRTRAAATTAVRPALASRGKPSGAAARASLVRHPRQSRRSRGGDDHQPHRGGSARRAAACRTGG